HLARWARAVGRCRDARGGAGAGGRGGGAGRRRRARTGSIAREGPFARAEAVVTRGRVHVSWLRLAAPLLLAFVAIASLRAFFEAARQPAADAPRLEFTVDGLDCPVWCAVRLSDGIDGLDGAEVEQI